MRQVMLQKKDIEIDSLRSTVEKLNKLLRQRKQLSIVYGVCIIPFTNW